MYKKLLFPRLLLMGSLFISLMGCSHPKMLYDKLGLTSEEFNRDKYDCVQQSRTSWSGGGTGGLGAAMIISAKSNAEKQSAEMFKMCMEARGYTAREVNDEEFERQKNNPFKTKMSQISKERIDRCGRDEFSLVFAKSPCKVENISLEQFSDNTIITEVERTVFSKYRSENTDSNNKLLEAIRTDGESKDKEMSLVLERIYLQADKNALDLFEGKITWGKYNKYRKELNQTYKEEKNRIFNNK